MKIITKIKQMQRIAKTAHRQGKAIGFVPTMGYLHEGHLSLIHLAKKKNNLVVVSIFVNPAQFGPKEDYKEYPRNLERDKILAKRAGCDILFVPTVEEMYPEDYLTYVNVEKITEVLCGASRPGHFRGVTTVVIKLFNIVQPNVAIFGQKDAQQAIVITQMVKDLNLPVKIIVAPIVREKDGLAMSSRNTYLSTEERKDATVLYQSLQLAKRMILEGERKSEKIREGMRKFISEKKSAAIDYIAIVNPENLQKIAIIEGKVLITLAVKIGKTRLIDNLLVTPPP
ncbi:MAG: pantoate--beta-alanine ligase [Candidatus Edwardsbacteria bacterium]